MEPNMSIINTNAAHNGLNGGQKAGVLLGSTGLLLLLLSTFGVQFPASFGMLILALAATAGGILLYAWHTYTGLPIGIKNNQLWFLSISNRGLWGMISAVLITGFYVVLYFMPHYLGQGAAGAANTGLIAFFDPLSQALKKQPASQWFVYGVLYTLGILAMGIKFIWKYRHNRYQVIRTCSVMFFQTGIAFLLPEFMQRLNQPYYDFKNMWPLDYDFFEKGQMDYLLNSGGVGLFMIVFGVAMIFIISPVLTYFYGKRWYCSWVCGCGGLAETVGDPFRQLSDKSLRAWKIERWLIHSVLVFVVVMTVAVLFAIFHENPAGYYVTRDLFLGLVLCIFIGLGLLLWLRPQYLKMVSRQVKIAATVIMALIIGLTCLAYFLKSPNVFFIPADWLKAWYGFFIGAIFSGVIGVGFYPLMGSRVWCRFGCPMAAILGLQQKFFSRFRITTNGGQCISCGNCSTYCEMGIDVRAYAQRGQDIVRASCVGCGICAAVCPRGVLRLENSALDLHTRAEAVRVIRIDVDKGVALSE
ncbi:4Fe-4S dicluster domain-containing protein [Haliscomenobacter hydrossis]|nr:4Fe-4S dicluster domain-containing protein [Haliscomenobacter hydrossis]